VCVELEINKTRRQSSRVLLITPSLNTKSRRLASLKILLLHFKDSTQKATSWPTITGRTRHFSLFFFSSRNPLSCWYPGLLFP